MRLHAGFVSMLVDQGKLDLDLMKNLLHFGTRAVGDGWTGMSGDGARSVPFTRELEPGIERMLISG